MPRAPDSKLALAVLRKARKLMRNPRGFVEDALENRRHALMRADLGRHGVCVLPRLFDPSEASRRGRELVAESDEARTRVDVARTLPTAATLILSPPLVNGVAAALGAEPRFLQVADLSHDRALPKWHRASPCRTFAQGLDWQPDYAVVKVVLCLDGHDTGLCFMAGSHRAACESPGDRGLTYHVVDMQNGASQLDMPAHERPAPLLIRPRPGDCVIFDARVLHRRHQLSGDGGIREDAREARATTLEACFGLDDLHAQRFYSYYRYLRTDLPYRAMPAPLVSELEQRKLLLGTGERNLFLFDPAQAKHVTIKSPTGMRAVTKADLAAQRAEWLVDDVAASLSELRKLPSPSHVAGITEVAQQVAEIITGNGGGSPEAQLAAMREAERAHTSFPPRTERIGKHMAAMFEAAGVKKGRLLEIGGRKNPFSDAFPEFEYLHLDLTETGPGVICGDITDCPQIESESFDAIISVDVFEHVNAPWKAASEITRLLRPGGITYQSTLFAWRYHPCPIDYWRFTPAALEFLFRDLTRLDSGFDTSERRRNVLGKGRHPVPLDAFGGWRENWRVFYAGIKPLC